jgi:hypothetical protein
MDEKRHTGLRLDHAGKVVGLTAIARTTITQHGWIGFLLALFLVAIGVTGLSTQAKASEQQATDDARVQPAVKPETPASRAKGPGSGYDYQRPAPAPGRGGPGYGRGYWGDPAHTSRNPGAVSPEQRFNRPRYGRDGRGYGYGYPGYRGQGGSGYPRHRQYANPPRYPVKPTPAEQAESQP